MGDPNRRDNTSRALSLGEIVAMFQCDLPRLSESDLAQSLLELRRVELDHIRLMLEPVIREELQRRRSWPRTDAAATTVP